MVNPRGYYVIEQQSNDKWMFNLHAANGEIIATSLQGYEAKQGALNGIASVQKNGSTTDIREE